MMKNIVVRATIVAAALTCTAIPASAQFTPRSVEDPATGEQYHVEGAIGLWPPGANMSISSEALGIIGSNINFKKDLGQTDHSFPEFRVELKPGRKHKFRFQYIPINYEQESVLTRDIVFQGIKFTAGLPVNSQLSWKAYRFAYEYDFISRNRGFVGLILDAKYTDVTAALQSPIDYEEIHGRAPVPTIGGVGRFYVAPNISITGELTGITVPNALSEQYHAHYYDLNFYGTVNFTNNIGAQIGYRMFNVGYDIKDDNLTRITDSGSFVLKGLFFGAVARF
jgi:hypothetical protein